jgi:hypothetical protein
MAMGELISVGAKYIREAKYINLFIYRKTDYFYDYIVGINGGERNRARK